MVFFQKKSLKSFHFTKRKFTNDFSNSFSKKTTCLKPVFNPNVNCDDIRFDSVVKKFAAQFQADFTYSLIVRLHHNVVKTAVIKIVLGTKMT